MMVLGSWSDTVRWQKNKIGLTTETLLYWLRSHLSDEFESFFGFLVLLFELLVLTSLSNG